MTSAVFRFFLVILLMGGCADEKVGAVVDPVAAHEENERERQPPTDAEEATLERVVDGDTIRVRYRGNRERVRYIGINTPELRQNHTPEPFAQQATEENRRLLGSGSIWLEFDVERRDHYGRLLCYVYLQDGTFVNEELVSRGLAQTMTVPPNVRFAEHFQRLEAQARQADRGLWGQ